MTKVERETLYSLRAFVQKMLNETILPPLYKEGFISQKYSVDVRINFRLNTVEEELRRMQIDPADAAIESDKEE